VCGRSKESQTTKIKPCCCPAGATRGIGSHEVFAAAHAEGQSLKAEEAVAYALSVEFEQNGNASRARASTDGLTAREIEVLRLLAAGHSNPEIAAALVISVKTVERHLANTYVKIGAQPRRCRQLCRHPRPLHEYPHTARWSSTRPECMSHRMARAFAVL
jgi:DNA-binding CsgD family transcriptional regulator